MGRLNIKKLQILRPGKKIINKYVTTNMEYFFDFQNSINNQRVSFNGGL